MSEIILEAKNIRKSFEKQSRGLFLKKQYKTAVSDVNLKLFKGEIHGIVGESGSGKSTLGSIMARLLKEDEGTVFFEQQDITNFSKREMKGIRKDIQMVFQNTYNSLNPSRKIKWLLKESLDINTKLTEREKDERIDEMISLTGLKQKHLSRYPRELSGGERQRVCIAMALMLNPKVIIADEAVSALDVSVQAQILNLMLELKEKLALSYIFISHDLNAVYYLSDRISVMQGGNIVESGSAEDIFYHHKHEYTKKLFNSIKPVQYGE